MPDFSQDEIDRACEDAMRKPTFHDELREAVYLCLESGMTLADILGETRRTSITVARAMTKTKTKAAKKLGIGRQTFRNIELHTHKY